MVSVSEFLNIDTNNSNSKRVFASRFLDDIFYILHVRYEHSTNTVMRCTHSRHVSQHFSITTCQESSNFPVSAPCNITDQAQLS